MKITIDNRSRRDITVAVLAVVDRIIDDRDAMLAHTVGGCRFVCKGLGVAVTLLPVAADRPAGETHFIVRDKEESK